MPYLSESSTSATPESLPFVTVVIPVRNEERFIRETILQILQQEYPLEKFEIIVADGLSSDTTQDIVGELSRQYEQVILMSNPGQLPSSGRNVGFRNGKGDLFLVIDGHCLIENRKMLKEMAEAFSQSGAACLGRPQPFYIPEQPGWHRAIAIARTSRLGHSSNSLIHSKFEGIIDPTSVGCAYKREVFAKIGYVDESFDACEDVEFNYRVKEAGFKSYFTYKIAVTYFPRENLSGLWKQLVRYGEGRARFMMKHTRTLNFDMLLPVLFTLGISAGWLMGFFHWFFLLLWILVLGIYLCIVSGVSVSLRKSEPFTFVFKLIAVLFVVHFSLGFGILKCFLKKWFKRI
jgi:glycosyltransferase involved in cell wall biosynthesis